MIIKELLKSGIIIRARIQGSSMLPFIKAGDCGVIKSAQWEEVNIGDIIAYSNNGKNNIICHRLVRREGSVLIAKGDTLLWGYETIHSGLLLGKLICIERGRNRISLETKFQRFLASKIAWISFNLPVLLFIIAYFIESLRAPHLVPIKLIRKIKQYKI